MEIIMFIIFCAIVGRIASLITHININQKVKFNIMIGILGTITGSVFLNLIEKDGITKFNLYGFTVALVSAVTIIAVVRILRHVHL